MKLVLVTGATKGLGLSIARRLCNDGFRVIGVGRTLTAEFAELMKADGDRKCHFIKFDLNNLKGIPELIVSITREYGPLYGLVNNAGIGSDGVLATQHTSEISEVLKVNLEAPILLSKYACRSMLVKKQGRIVNVSSIIATTGFNGLAVYGASKAGLEGFTKSLSRELGRARITVNCLAPGYMETDMTKGLSEEKMVSIRRRAPLGLPKTDDAAGAVSYLLSDDGAMVTGTILTVDGGSTA